MEPVSSQQIPIKAYSSQVLKLIPQIAFNYEPTEWEKTNLLRNVQTRRIFHWIDFGNYSKKEQESIKEFNSILLKKFITLPKWWTLSNTLRHWQGCEYNIDDTWNSIQFAVKFMSNSLTVPHPLPDDIHDILNSGFLYIHGMDNRFRPWVFVNPAFYDSNKYPYATYEKAIVIFIQYIIDNCFIEGKIENWDMIVDLSEMSLLSIPYDWKELHKSVKNVYRCRLFKLYVLNLSTWWLYTWKIAKVFMGVTIEAKVCMVDYDGQMYNKVYEFINRDQTEEKYGGKQPNLKKGEYFPPRFIGEDHKIFVDNEEDNKLQRVLKGDKCEDEEEYLQVE